VSERKKKGLTSRTRSLVRSEREIVMIEIVFFEVTWFVVTVDLLFFCIAFNLSSVLI
jgi:uncharacterized membrane protein